MQPEQTYTPLDRIDIGLPITHEFGNLPKLAPDVKAAWLTALRSGEYTQITGALKALRPIGDTDQHDEAAGPNYCCLGVLCDLSVQHEIIGESKREREEKWVATDEDEDEGRWEETGLDLHYWTYLGNEDMPPNPVNEWANLSEPVATWLATKNDDGASFQDIADFIEREL